MDWEISPNFRIAYLRGFEDNVCGFLAHITNMGHDMNFIVQEM